MGFPLFWSISASVTDVMYPYSFGENEAEFLLDNGMKDASICFEWSTVLDLANKQIFRFILVIKGHEESWLPPVREVLRREMMAEIKIWKHEVIVINDQQTKKRGLIR